MRFEPSAGRLTLKFEIDPAWRTGARGVTYTFEDVHIRAWRDLSDGLDGEDGDRWQVGLFDWDDAWTFWLVLTGASLWFEASAALIEVDFVPDD
ncbi:hypothetical protein ACOACO_16895 [Nocardioides sp. CPCC 205120]|uniref:hypothetical protein n=1 Tax=Nocardioides sp. CPCC 205120 TaxID=3406462 RepID=UPI003B50FD64